MKQIKVVVMAVVFGAFAMSCQKIEKYDQIDFLVEKEWRLASITENGQEVSDSCELDDTMLLSREGEVTNNFGTLNCDEENSADKWTFAKDYTQIKMRYVVKGSGIARGVGFDRFDIIELTENRLVLKEIWPNEQQDMPQIFTYQAE